MDVERFLGGPLSRRGLLRGSGSAFAGGSAVAVAACGGGGKSGKRKPTEADVAILNGAIDLENRAIAAYTASAPLLKGEMLRFARQFLRQEKEHANALSQAVLGAGGHPRHAKSSYSFPAVRNRADALGLLETIGNVAMAAYLDAVTRLSIPDLRARVASIATNEAEHVAVIRGALGQPQVPAPFVVGRR